MPTRPLIIVSLEGIAPHALSCYGCSWNQTPSLDRIAANGLLWDRLTANTDLPGNLFSSWTSSQVEWAERFRSIGPVVLISDDELHELGEHCFDEITLLPFESVQENQVAEEEAFQTRFGQLVATAIDRIRQPEAMGAIWIHSSFLTRCWDAPLKPMESVTEVEYLEESIELESNQEANDANEVEYSNEVCSKLVIPPSFQITPEDDPDLIPQWIDRYGAQVGLIDMMMDYLLEEAEQMDAQIVFLGTSGFRLGQGGEFGTEPEKLRSGDIHLPLLIGSEANLRIPHLTCSEQIPEILKSLAIEGEPTYTAEQWAQSRSNSPTIPIQSSRTASAAMSPKWFCVIDSDGAENLFLKPDDVDDYNNVARLRPDVVDELIALSNQS